MTPRPSESALQRDVEFPGLTTLVERMEAPRARFTLLDDMIVEKGTSEDWDKLHDLHYKAEKLPIGPHIWRLRLYEDTIGVLVFGVPRGMIRERHKVFDNIRPKGRDTQLVNANRYHYINKHFRVISRSVVDTQFRGIGAGAALANLASRLEGVELIEIQSSMSKYNQFGQKAGFSFVKPENANSYDKVLKFLRLNFAANPVDYEAILAEIASKSQRRQDQIHEMLKEFYFKNSAQENTVRGGDQMEARAAKMTTRTLVRGIQQMGLASPLYGIYRNPDYGRTDMPESLPLSAFWRQKPDEPLVLT